MVASFNPRFDIRNFASNLTSSHKGANYYKCPVCNGSSLHINPATGAYKCFSNECDSASIREVVSPSGELFRTKPQLVLAAPTSGAAIPTNASIALLSEPKPITAGAHKGNQYQIRYGYSDSQFVVRYEYQRDGQRKKHFTPHYIDSHGVVIAKKGDKPWPLYGNQDVDMWGGGNWINEAEGEKGADYLASIGLVGCSTTGTANENDIRYAYQQAINAGIVGIVYHQDNDRPGEIKANKHKKIADAMGIPFIIIAAKELDPDIKEAGDIADLIAENKITKDSLILFIENKIKAAANNNKSVDQPANKVVSIAVDNTKPATEPVVTFNQIALKLLYLDTGYKAINGQLAKWQGTFYALKTDADELKRISDFCNSYPVVTEQKDDKPKVTYPFAKPKAWKEVLECAKTRLHIGSNNFQTTGINCKNGVLTINWEGNKPIVNFEKHDPEKHFFISEPQIEYNPLADSKYCDQLLLCLDPSQREILLRNLAASLDILTVRKYHGRKIKLLLCIGGGANGKDSIREVVSLIFGGKGMTSFSLDDFIDYDRGIKNSLAGLELSRVNWSSESNKTTRLDSSKSLKSFATGDTLIARYLHKDGVPFIPQSVGLFNLNEAPNLYSTSQAAMDRFAPVTFNKTFVSVDKYDPSNKAHMIADPRFKYDPQFIVKEVAPAFLNVLIQELKNLMEFGIDYSCCQDKLNQIQKDNNHLFAFCESINLHYQEGASIAISELWQHLEQYYLEQEILTIDSSGNRRWADPVRPSDKYVKGANQVYERLQAIFPNITKDETRLNGATKPNKFIRGLSVIHNIPKRGEGATPVYTPVDTPVIPQLYPTYTPVEKPQNTDTVSTLPSSYTPYTPVSNNYSEKKQELEKTCNQELENSNDSENKEYCEQTGVYGVYESSKTLTKPKLEGDSNWGISGGKVGGKVGYTPEVELRNSTFVQDIKKNTPPVSTSDDDIKTKLGIFKEGDRVQIAPQGLENYNKKSPRMGTVVKVVNGADGIWEVCFYEHLVWNKESRQYEPQGDIFGRGVVLSGWVRKVPK